MAARLFGSLPCTHERGAGEGIFMDLIKSCFGKLIFVVQRSQCHISLSSLSWGRSSLFLFPSLSPSRIIRIISSFPLWNYFLAFKLLLFTITSLPPCCCMGNCCSVKIKVCETGHKSEMGIFFFWPINIFSFFLCGRS